jgi:hypothetical protein
MHCFVSQHNEKVARIIGKRWKALSSHERKTFQSMADRDKVRCQQENENYIKRMHEKATKGPSESDGSTKKVHCPIEPYFVVSCHFESSKMQKRQK